jgi:nucleoside-triphosphatase THEP1
MKNILITGFPGVGKTTLIMKILKELSMDVVGFVTKEIRKDGIRYGFNIETLSGESRLLAAKEGKRCKYNVGKYCVYVDNVDTIVKMLEEENRRKTNSLVVIDEIGKMELFSTNFKNFLLEGLDEQRVLGTIMIRDNPFTEEIKKRSDVRLFNIDRNNRDSLHQIILAEIMNNFDFS